MAKAEAKFMQGQRVTKRFYKVFNASSLLFFPASLSYFLSVAPVCTISMVKYTLFVFACEFVSEEQTRAYSLHLCKRGFLLFRCSTIVIPQKGIAFFFSVCNVDSVMFLLCLEMCCYCLNQIEISEKEKQKRR